MMNHISDEDIQRYLDKDPTLNKAGIEKHLQSCGECGRNYLLYQQLYTGLADETGFMLSANFSESVVSQIQRRDEKSYNFFESLLLTIAGLFSLGLIFYFTNLGEVIWGALQVNVRELEPMLNGIGNILGGNLTILIFAIAIIFLFGVADKLIIQMKHR